jgi:hypothetical protein
MKRTFRFLAGILLLWIFTEPALGASYAEPQLQIKIPTVDFSGVDLDESGTTVNIPYLAEYISGLYQYLILLAGVVASVLTIMGGFQYLTAGGDAGKVKAAKERITNAIAGVVLLLGAYTILRTISPSLVELKGLVIPIVRTEEFVNEEQPGVPEAATAGDSDAHDATFKKYAACAGLDWRILKAVAKKESGFRADVTNKFGFIGLFQTNTKNCSLTRYGRSADCTAEALKNPDNNTASAAGGQLKSGAKTLKSMCPEVKSTEKFVMLLYYGHNSGAGALRSVLKKVGCDATTEEYFNASTEFWKGVAEAKGKDTIPNYDSRMQYAQKVGIQAAAYGVTNPFDTSQSAACPLK